jgi:patatin-related protein
MMNGAEAPTMDSDKGMEKELRLALAIRGGVSLAVWMGGACSEVDRLRRTSPGDPTPYGILLRAAGYHSAVVDVVAGTSAGGLNGALMASSIVYGSVFDQQVRDLWLQLGDLGQLVRPVFGRRPESLLNGDGYFYAQLHEQMSNLRREPPPGQKLGKARLDLVLTGTLLEPRVVEDYPALGAPIKSVRHRAAFRFRHQLRPSKEEIPLPPGFNYPLSDFEPSENAIQSLRQLAYAARSTSSFPGAFEPARIRFADPSSAPDSAPPEPPSTFYGIYSESRQPSDGDGEPDLVVDGGVLDNIPIAWAVRSIAAAPANGAVDRWLVYLQPLPPSQPKSRPMRTPWRMFNTLLRVQQVKAKVESIADDFDHLNHYQQEARRREGFHQVLDQILGQGIAQQDGAALLQSVARRARAAAADYRKRLGKLEAERISALWCNPLPVLGVDPLGYRGIKASPLAGRPKRSETGAICAVDLLATLNGSDSAELALDPVVDPEADDFNALVTLGSAIRTPQALGRTVGVLLDACHGLDEAGHEFKADLYDIRFGIELLIACHDRALVDQADADTRTGDAVELVRRALFQLTGRPRSTGWPADPFRAYWDRLVQHASQLAKFARDSKPAPGSGSALLTCLDAAQDERDPAKATEALLVAIELLTGPLRPDPLAETCDINFHMVSADNTTPIKQLMRDEKTPLPVDRKLAGNQLYNFGGFLSARWRLNDWTWGRMDAARSLVDITAHHLDDAGWDTLARHMSMRRGTSHTKLLDELCHRLHLQILHDELPLLARLRNRPPDLTLIKSVQSAPTDRPDPPDVELLLKVGKESWRRLALRRFKVILRLLGVTLRTLLPVYETARKGESAAATSMTREEGRLR